MAYEDGRYLFQRDVLLWDEPPAANGEPAFRPIEAHIETHIRDGHAERVVKRAPGQGSWQRVADWVGYLILTTQDKVILQHGGREFPFVPPNVGAYYPIEENEQAAALERFSNVVTEQQLEVQDILAIAAISQMIMKVHQRGWL